MKNELQVGKELEELRSRLEFLEAKVKEHDFGCLGSPTDRPLSLLEQVKQEQRIGEPDWFNKRRQAYSSAGTSKAAGGIVLPLDLLKDNKSVSLLPMVPDEAPVFLGGPRTVGRPQSKPLKRFSGKKVTPANFTQIYNGDGRQIYYDTSFPWVCVGQLLTPGGNWGTASLVGKRTILTASHVLSGLWSPGGTITGPITFVPAMFGGTSILGRDWSANVIGITAWESTTNVDGYDMAICQLDKPMGEWLGAFGCRAYDDDWEDLSVWTHAGYPYDLTLSGNQPCYELSIAVQDDDSDSYDTLEVETEADIASGQSGGPLWGVFDGGKHQIIGTLSGREDNFLEAKNSLFAGGNGLVRLVGWGRDNWG